MALNVYDHADAGTKLVIDRLKARVAELEAWQTNICQMIQSAAMDGESIVPRQIVDLTYDRW